MESKKRGDITPDKGGFEAWWDHTHMTVDWIEKPFFRKDVVLSWARQAWQAAKQEDAEKLATAIEALGSLVFHCQDYGVEQESLVMLMEVEKARKAIAKIKGEGE